MKPRRALARGKTVTPTTDGSGARSDDDLVRLWLAARPRSTVKAYTADLDWWRSRGVPPPGGLRSLRLTHIAPGLGELAEGSPATRARRVAALRSVLSWGHRVGYLPLNIGAVLKLPPVPSKLAERILEPDEVLRLLAAAAAAPRQGMRDHCFVRVAYVSGARVDELVRLNWQHIHPASEGGASLTLHGKGGKTRHVWVTPGTAAELAELAKARGAPTGPVFVNRFGKRLSVRSAERLVEAATKRAKLQGKVSPHWLRHGHATHALERGAPIHQVAADLGHSSVATTSRYLHVRPGDGSARYLGL